MRKILKNKPLIEVIFELRWELQEIVPGIIIDPNYKILVGRISDKVKNDYPFYEQLPMARIPDDVAGYIVQHRFRKSENKWPLIQVGPGIVTLNDTDGYTWEDFEERIHNLVEVLWETYPEADTNLKVNGLLLRYIDAIEFDYEKENIFEFLETKLKIKIALYEKLFEETGVRNIPLGFDLRFSFPSKIPEGIIHLKFSRGQIINSDAIVWETQVQSLIDNSPNKKEQIFAWVRDAHELTDNWFFKLIEGDLLRRFE